MSARLIQVIETHLQARGAGTENNPVRRLRQYWSAEGELLAEVDPVTDRLLEEQSGRLNQMTKRIGELEEQLRRVQYDHVNALHAQRVAISAGLAVVQGVRKSLPSLQRLGRRFRTARMAAAAIERALGEGAQKLEAGGKP